MEINEDLTVIIRQAGLEDIENIWDIIHANCRTWSIQQIGNNLNKMFVLVKNHKILGVLCVDFSSGVTVIDWVEIHPLYPEKTLREVMIQGLLGTQRRDDAVKFPKKALSEQLSPIRV